MAERPKRRVTAAMLKAATRAEYDYYRRDIKDPNDRFIPIPEAVLRVIIEAALKAEEEGKSPHMAPSKVPVKSAFSKGKLPRIVTAPKPKRRVV
jgi:hypothetical protein